MKTAYRLLGADGRLTELYQEWVTFRTLHPSELIHMIVIVVARLCRGQTGKGVVNSGYESAEISPFVETQCNSFLRRMKFPV